ncbi:MAG: peptide-methionine (S)-S-oxide reductase MsrA [Pseudobdellovibrionaceae bacterium]
MERIVLGSGCFWGAQEILRKIPGVIKTEVGYAGGTLENATYNEVKTGRTGHAESVELTYDPQKVSLGQILDVFFRMHDPTTEDRQGNDVGSQYRSVIFYFSEDQKKAVLEKIKEIEQKGFWKKPIVTEVVPFSNYYRAEEFHQDYLIKHPNGYSCHYLRDF